MAKDMSSVYASMLTKELVQLRAKHTALLANVSQSNTRFARKETARLRDLIAQINNELAERVANFNLFV